MVEFALSVALYLLVILCGLQLALLAVQYYGAMHIARDTARWVAIRPDTIDSDVVAHAYAISTGLPGTGPSGLASVTIDPSCTSLVSGRCANRQPGDIVSVSITPRLSRVLFLPTTLSIGSLRVSLPATLPACTVSVMIE